MKGPGAAVDPVPDDPYMELYVGGGAAGAAGIVGAGGGG